MSKFTIPFDSAVEVAGSPVELSRVLDVSESAVSQWKEKGYLPEGRSWQMAALFPGRFSVPALAQEQTASSNAA